MRRSLEKRFLLLFLCILFTGLTAKAQLNASFSAGNTNVEIKNTSTPTPTSFTLVVDGTQILYPDYLGRYNYFFSTAGQHTIQLTNKFGDCEETISQNVEVRELPQPKGFIGKQFLKPTIFTMAGTENSKVRFPFREFMIGSSVLQTLPIINRNR